eukprot:TRINITY_DN3039_c0_g1_i3.p1 TRINITY_DN3039_c0_g1~~TRINITY_DN3039_c0_g1_i3.p1  ORF type:complete len:368 (+),score=96.35 TRINITY_DN3039_c0_g1_i3:57-1160(+)
MGNLCLTRAGKSDLRDLRDFEGKRVEKEDDEIISGLISRRNPLEVFTFKRRLGKGCFGEVWEAVDNRDDFIVAIKLVNLLNEEDSKHVVYEAAAMLLCQKHPNIVEVYGLYSDFAWNQLCVFNGPRMWIVQENIGSTEPASLLTLLTDKEANKMTTSVEDVNAVLKQCSSAFAHMHSKGVIHRDIKPENIMIDSNNTIKIIDFGSALILPEGSDSAPCASIVGSWPYIAPEAYQGEYWKQGDVFSLGCVAVELWLGKDKGALELVKGGDGETPLLQEKAMDLMEAETEEERGQAIRQLTNCITDVLLKEAVARLTKKATAATLVTKKEFRGQARRLKDLLLLMLNSNHGKRITMDAVVQQLEEITLK